MSQNQTFYRMVIPSVGAMLVSGLYVVVDGIFVGRGVGVDGLAAVNIAVPFLTIMTAITMMVTMGGATITAIRFGQNDIPGANRSFHASVQMILVFSVGLALCSWLFPREIARLLGASPTLLEDTAVYLQYYVLFSIFFCGAMALSAFVRSDGAPRLAFWGMVVGAVSNIALDWLFIFPLQMGVKGAAIASGLGQVLACLLLSTHFIRRKGALTLSVRVREPGLRREILLRGLPEFVNQMGQPVTIFCYNLLAMRFLGEIGVSAFSVVNYLVVITTAIFIGVSQGVQPLISRSFGEKDEPKEQFFFRKGLTVNFILALSVNFVMLLFGKGIISVFNSNAQLISIAYSCINIYGISFLFASVNIVWITHLLATKHTGQAVLLSMLRGLLCNTLFIFLVPAIFGKEAVWTGIIAAELVVMGTAITLTGRRKRTGA